MIVAHLPPDKNLYTLECRACGVSHIEAA